MPSSLFKQQLTNNPDSLAITDLTSRRTWRELHARVTALVTLLQTEYGIAPGDHIALLVGNRIDHVEAMLAGQLAGAWVTPVNTHLTASEIDYIRHDCGASLVFCDNSHEALLAPHGTGQIINLQTLGPLPTGTEIDESSPCGGSMLYTSGTTGRPKGVRRAKPDTVGQLLDRMRQAGRNFGLQGGGPHLVTGPLYHAAPGLLALYDLINGAPMIILPKWDCDTFFNAVQQYSVTTTHLVPTMFVRLLQHIDDKGNAPQLPSLNYVLHGAAPIAQSVKKRMIDWWGPILTEYWGGTESGIVTMVTSEEWLNHPGTVGKAIGNFDVFVGDESGKPIADDTGLLYCRHTELAQIFSYHNDPEKTAKAHPQPHVMSLGDIGRVDKEGFVYLSDRASHMIISGGVNIYPQEVEQALMNHPQILDVAVFGIPNPEWGEEVKALVQLQTGHQPSSDLAAAIRDFARQHLAGFKIPRSIEFTQALPRTATGKLRIHELRNKYT